MKSIQCGKFFAAVDENVRKTYGNREFGQRFLDKNSALFYHPEHNEFLRAELSKGESL